MVVALTRNEQQEHTPQHFERNAVSINIDIPKAKGVQVISPERLCFDSLK
jgi:hypothetical protein